jgi:membrane protein HdeD
MVSLSATKFSAIITILLGVLAIVLPYFVGTLAVMLLAAVMLASGVIALFTVNAGRQAGLPLSTFGPWVQIIAGVVLIIWPQLALWLVAVILGGGLLLSGIMGLSALRQNPRVNPPTLKKVELWSSILLGVLLILMGAAGSAILLGIILGIALISNGLQQWRMASLWS